VYSPATVDHFSQPRNVGRLPDADGIGRVDDRATDNLVEISLKLDRDRVVTARFRVFGCSACVAAGSAATELATGQPLTEVVRITAAAVLTALDGLPPDKLHCAELAAQALGEAVAMAVNAT
jgi:nitrogen fixation protein NifU and related proteins